MCIGKGVLVYTKDCKYFFSFLFGELNMFLSNCFEGKNSGVKG